MINTWDLSFERPISPPIILGNILLLFILIKIIRSLLDPPPPHLQSLLLIDFELSIIINHKYCLSENNLIIGILS